MISWWNKAQQYERSYTAGHVQIHGEDIRHRPGNLSPEFTQNDEFHQEIIEWVAGKTCLEVGASVCPSITGLRKAKKVVLVEPMADQFRDYIWMPPNGILISQPGEVALPQFTGKIDGLIVDRNCIDHAEDPLWLFNCILNCAAPGCWVFHWSDIWHFPEPDAGHRNITQDSNVIRDFITFRQFDIIHEFTQRTSADGMLDYGCVARKRGSVKNMICILDHRGKCDRHQRIHTGKERDLCLEDSPRGEEFRSIIDPHGGVSRAAVLFSHRTAAAMLAGEPPPTPPTLVQKAVSLTKAVVKHVLAGMPVAADSGKRMDLCRKCEYFSGGDCLKCGCNMSVKTAMALERCPVGKW